MLFGAYMDELLYTSLKYNRMQMDLDGNGRSSKTSGEVIALDWIESSTEQDQQSWQFQKYSDF